MNPFKIINVSTLNLSEYFPDKNDKSKKKAERMYKVLKENTSYPFYDGYTIHDDTVTYNSKYGSITDDLYHWESGEKSISICAIVGENGSGKSTIVELMMRIINNLSVMFIGEGLVTPIAAHLHRIPNLYASMLCLINEDMWEFTALNDKISVKKFTLVPKSSTSVSKEWKLDSNSKDTREYVYRLGQKSSFHKVESVDEIRNLGKWFYTIITNYSLYSYNCMDYDKELTSKRVEDAIYKERGLKLKRPYTIEERCWLKGLFHKNDGYQTPIVINPMRENGNIDVGNEKKLSLERLMAVVHHKGIHKEYFKINDKLTAKAVRFSLNSNTVPVTVDSERANKTKVGKELYKFSSLAVYSSLEFCPDKNKKDDTGIDAELFGALYDEIKQMCIRVFGLGGEKNIQKVRYYDEALQYIVYKILKITRTYNNYHLYYSYFKELQSSIDNTVKEKIERLCLTILYDHSHIMTKLWQAVFYIKYNLLANYQSEFDIQDYAAKIKSQLDKTKDGLPINKKYEIEYINLGKYKIFTKEVVAAAPLRLEELLPPPIFELELIVYNSNQKVPFNTLSSGETQIAFAVSSFLYHLLNLDSVVQQPEGPYKNKILKLEDNSPSHPDGDRVAYEYINAVFDEAEMYFHPDMQRRFIAFLLDGLRQITLVNIKAINIMLITHSPFVLSDIPSSSILFLEKNGIRSPNSFVKTFGANVYDLLHYSFFLKDSYMGEFARKYINKQIAIICFWKAFRNMTHADYNNYTSKEKKAIIKRLQNEQKYLKNNFKDIYQLLGLDCYSQADFEKKNKQDEIKKKLCKHFGYDELIARVKIIDEPVIRIDLIEQLNTLFAESKKGWLEKQISLYNTELEKMKGGN